MTYQICQVTTKRTYIKSRNVTRTNEVLTPVEFYDTDWNKVTECDDLDHVIRYCDDMNARTPNKFQIRQVA